MSLEETIAKVAADNPLAEGKRFAEGKRWLYHGSTGLLARAEKFYDGEQDVYHSPAGVPARGPVMAFEGGHSLVWVSERFVELSDTEAMFVASVTTYCSSLVERSLAIAAFGRMEKKSALHIIRGVLSMQTIAIEHALQQLAPGASHAEAFG